MEHHKSINDVVIVTDKVTLMTRSHRCCTRGDLPSLCKHLGLVRFIMCTQQPEFNRLARLHANIRQCLCEYGFPFQIVNAEDTNGFGIIRLFTVVACAIQIANIDSIHNPGSMKST